MFELWQALLGSERVLLSGPVKPDGDSIGACLALQASLRQRGVHADVAGKIVSRYAWMPGAAEFLSDDAVVSRSYDCVVILDGDMDRLTPGVNQVFRSAPVKAIIDHHSSTEPSGYDYFWIESNAASTCEMLFKLFEHEQITITRPIAAALYTGFIFDTGSFRYSNTSPTTHRMAATLLETGIDHARITAKVLLERSTVGMRAMGRVYSDATFVSDGAICVGAVSLEMANELKLSTPDLEGIVDSMVFINDVEIAALAIQKQDNRVKFSLRSRDQADVCTIAQNLSPTGGGHRKAAGATLNGDLETCIAVFLEEATESLMRLRDTV